MPVKSRVKSHKKVSYGSGNEQSKVPPNANFDKSYYNAAGDDKGDDKGLWEKYLSGWFPKLDMWSSFSSKIPDDVQSQLDDVATKIANLFKDNNVLTVYIPLSAVGIALICLGLRSAWPRVEEAWTAARDEYQEQMSQYSLRNLSVKDFSFFRPSVTNTTKKRRQSLRGSKTRQSLRGSKTRRSHRPFKTR
jgi:hypothetical protein